MMVVVLKQPFHQLLDLVAGLTFSVICYRISEEEETYHDGDTQYLYPRGLVLYIL